jgi:hypothetical protein
MVKAWQTDSPKRLRNDSTSVCARSSEYSVDENLSTLIVEKYRGIRVSCVRIIRKIHVVQLLDPRRAA